jgi:hypothetical protein
MRRFPTLALTAVISLAAAPVTAGTFLDLIPNQNRVVHAGGYTGGGGELAVSVCLDPGALPPSGDPEQAIRNAVATFNALTPTPGNVVSRSDGAGGSDFESVLLHEVGHCVGLDHSALGPSETGSFDDPLTYFANAFRGGNGAFDGTAGADGVRGSRDDQRGDDVNRNWFRKNVNNPFETPPAVVDRSSYSVALSDLPVGHSFVENSSAFGPCPGPSTSQLRGLSPTQNVMFPVICSSNHLRRLAPDDVAVLRIAKAGQDGVQGSADDYTLKLNYIGKTADCQIKIQFTNDAGFAVCAVEGTTLGSDVRITSGTVKFLRTGNWYYNPNDTTGGGGGAPACSGTCVFRNGFEP